MTEARKTRVLPNCATTKSEMHQKNLNVFEVRLSSEAGRDDAGQAGLAALDGCRKS